MSQKVDECKPLVGGTFGGFTSQGAAGAFDRQVLPALEPPVWCSECHPHGCKNLIPPEVIAKGRLLPVRQAEAHTRSLQSST